MARTVEDRVRALEGFRHAALGRINAIQTLTLNAMLDVVMRGSEDPIATATDIREKLLAAADKPGRKFHGVNPATLDAVSQEYKDAIDDLTGQLVATVRGAVQNRNRRGKGTSLR